MRAGALLFFLLFVRLAPAAERFVSPGAKGGGDGGREAPYTLAEPLAQPANVAAGDTVWLLGGVYRGVFTSTLKGTASAPIVVKQRPGERATLDGGDSNGKAVLTVGGAYTWY